MRKSILQDNKNRITTGKGIIRKPGFMRIFLVRFLVTVFIATVIFAGLVYGRRYFFKEWLVGEAEKYDEETLYPGGEYSSNRKDSYYTYIISDYEKIFNIIPKYYESFESLSEQDKRQLFKNSLLGDCSSARLLNDEKNYNTIDFKVDNDLDVTLEEPNTLIYYKSLLDAPCEIGVNYKGPSEAPYEIGINYICQDKAVSEAIDNISKKIDKNYKQVAVYFTVDDIYLKDDFTFVADKIHVTYVVDDNYDPEYDEYITMDLPSKEEMEKQGYTYYKFDDQIYLGVYYTSLPKGAKEVPSLTDSHFQLLKWTTLEREVTYDLSFVEGFTIYDFELDFVDQYKYLKQKAEDEKTIWPEKGELTNFEILRREGIIIYVIAIMLALFISIVTFLKQKSIYELDTYRRELTNVMAHDLKTPLMVLRGNAENLVDVMHSDEESDRTKGDKYAGNIMTNVDYMTALINKTLMLSSLESGNGMLEKKNFSVREVLENLTDSSEALREKRDIDVEIIGDDRIISADEFWISEAFRNIIDNASKYADVGSTLKVMIEKRRIVFSNKATNLTEEDMKRIADPFSKHDKARSGKAGSGIGLTIVKNVFELHGWKMKTKLIGDIFMVEIKGINK